MDTAMKDGNFEGFQACFTLPVEIQKFQGRSLVTDVSALRSVFDAARKHYVKTGVTEVVHHCVEAEFTDPNRVVATHENRLVSRNVTTQDPCPVLSVLHYDGEGWFVTGSSYAIEGRSDHNAALLCAEFHKGVRPSPA
jgi:hypothetical protein